MSDPIKFMGDVSADDAYAVFSFYDAGEGCEAYSANVVLTKGDAVGMISDGYKKHPTGSHFAIRLEHILKLPKLRAKVTLEDE